MHVLLPVNGALGICETVLIGDMVDWVIEYVRLGEETPTPKNYMVKLL